MWCALSSGDGAAREEGKSRAMILLTHNMLASPMKEAAKQLPLGSAALGRAPACACVFVCVPSTDVRAGAHPAHSLRRGGGGAWAAYGAQGRGGGPASAGPRSAGSTLRPVSARRGAHRTRA